MDNETGLSKAVDAPSLDTLFADIEAALAKGHQVSNDTLQPGEFTARMWAEHEGIPYNTASGQLGYLLRDGVLTRRRIKRGWAYRMNDEKNHLENS